MASSFSVRFVISLWFLIGGQSSWPQGLPSPSPLITTRSITTRGKGIYKVPPDVEHLVVTGCGGGGGGGPFSGPQRGPVFFAGGGGGSGAPLITLYLHVTPLQDISYEVGNGGSGGGEARNASDGAVTKFDILLFPPGNGGGGGSPIESGPFGKGGPSVIWGSFTGPAGGDGAEAKSKAKGKDGDKRSSGDDGGGTGGSSSVDFRENAGGGGGGASYAGHGGRGGYVQDKMAFQLGGNAEGHCGGGGGGAGGWNGGPCEGGPGGQGAGGYLKVIEFSSNTPTLTRAQLEEAMKTGLKDEVFQEFAGRLEAVEIALEIKRPRAVKLQPEDRERKRMSDRISAIEERLGIKNQDVRKYLQDRLNLIYKELGVEPPAPIEPVKKNPN